MSHTVREERGNTTVTFDLLQKVKISLFVSRKTEIFLATLQICNNQSPEEGPLWGARPIDPSNPKVDS